MTDPDGTGQPRLRRSALRHLRDSLVKTEHRFSAAVTQPQAGPDQSAAPDPGEQRGGTVLTVCTGNICRSPMGEMLLCNALDGLDIRVHSAGKQALATATEGAHHLRLARVRVRVRQLRIRQRARHRPIGARADRDAGDADAAGDRRIRSRCGLMRGLRPA